MHRIQVQLTAEQERALRELASLRGASISALIREGVDRLLEPSEGRRAAAVRRTLELLGSFESDVTDAAARHDDYLAAEAARTLHGR